MRSQLQPLRSFLALTLTRFHVPQNEIPRPAMPAAGLSRTALRFACALQASQRDPRTFISLAPKLVDSLHTTNHCTNNMRLAGVVRERRGQVRSIASPAGSITLRALVLTTCGVLGRRYPIQ